LGWSCRRAAAIGDGDLRRTLSGGDTAATTAAIHLGIGLFVWAPLVFLFDLHRRERREAVEIERLAQDEPTGVFETERGAPRGALARGDAEVRAPAMSLLIGGSLLAIGFVRFRAANGRGLGSLCRDDCSTRASASRSGSRSRSRASSSPGL
jgi:hypothetical protein